MIQIYSAFGSLALLLPLRRHLRSDREEPGDNAKLVYRPERPSLISPLSTHQYVSIVSDRYQGRVHT